jgi:hypothetical protein
LEPRALEFLKARFGLGVPLAAAEADRGWASVNRWTFEEWAPRPLFCFLGPFHFGFET